MLIKACVIILCLGIVVILGGIAMLCCAVWIKKKQEQKQCWRGFCCRVLGWYAYCSGQSVLHRPSLSG